MDVPRLATLALVMTIAMSHPAAAQSKPGFQSDFETAKALAASSGRPLLIHFYADYCPPCRRMEAEVFSDIDFGKKLSDAVVAVKVNTAERTDLAQRYGVDRIPHDRLVAPDGQELLRAGGFIPKWSYLSMIETAAKKFAATQPKPEPKPKKQEPLAKQPIAKPVIADVPKGLDGYCPVELGRNRRWLKGQAEFEIDYKGITYQIASKENYEAFRKDPERFAPQVLGCDPVVLASSQKAIPGRTNFGAFFDGKLYLFKSNDSRTTFKQNPLKYVRIQHALDASKIERVVIR